MKAKKFLSVGAAVLAIVYGTAAFAAGSDDYADAAAKPATYNAAVGMIKDKNYADAIIQLEAAEKSTPKDADVQNLLGFAHRKSGQLNKAAAYYSSALTLDPKHKGALEYQGELFLMLGDKASAEKNLQKLDKICWLGWSELDDLRTAIRNYQP